MNNENKRWYAAYTKPRCEKKADRLLQLKQIQSWCPVQKIQRQWSDRKKIIEEPLFKSYVFVHISEEEKTEVLKTDGIIQFIYYLGKPAIIRESEIELIKCYLLEKDAHIQVEHIGNF